MASKDYVRRAGAFDRLAGALDWLFDCAPDRSFKIDVSVIEEE